MTRISAIGISDKVTGDKVTESSGMPRRPSSPRYPVTPLPQKGFTLLEMLVVLVVMAIGMSAVALAFRPDARRPLAQEAERLALLLEQAREESQLSGTSLAWEWRAGGYTFVRRDLTDNGPEWLPVVDDDIYRARTLPGGATIRQVRADNGLVPEGGRVALNVDGVQRLEIQLSLQEARTQVVSEPDGRGFQVLADAAGS
jgi:general secretion pathway protein H